MRTWRMRTTLVGQLRWLRDSFELWQCFFVVVFVFFQYYSPWFVFKRLSRCISSLKILLAAKGGELTRLWVCGQGDLELQQVFCFAEASLHLRSFSDHLCGREWPQWLSGVWSCLIDLCLVYSCQFEWTRTCLLRRKKKGAYSVTPWWVLTIKWQMFLKEEGNIAKLRQNIWDKVKYYIDSRHSEAAALTHFATVGCCQGCSHAVLYARTRSSSTW